MDAEAVPIAGHASGLWTRLERVLPVAAGVLLFGAALAVLRVELHAVRWPELVGDVSGVPVSRLLAALGLTIVNYAALTGYDLLAFEYAGAVLPRRRIVGVALVAYAVAHSVGFAALSGASVRYRFYSRWGVTADELSRIVVGYSVTFWVGLLALGGVSLAVSPLPIAPGMPPPALVRSIGVLLALVPLAYIAAAASRRTPVRCWRVAIPMPPAGLALRQVAVSIADWLLAGAVLYVLLPTGAPPFLPFLGAYLVAILLGLVSHVPGGMGVFEGLMVLLLKPWLTAGDLLPAFVVYRTIYYLLPFVLAVIVLVADEAAQRRAQVARASVWLGRRTERGAPRLLAAGTFLSGVVLLFSGATPAAPGRLDLVNRVLPLGVIETSHFIGSVAGAGLLVLSQGLARRLDAAYYLSSILIAVGMTASLLKGFDVEEAGLLLVMLLVLHRARPAFDRRAAFFATRFSPRWIAALAGAVAASVWLGFFAFAHVDYASELWWRFELTGEASRFLRASVGAAVVVLLVGLARLIGHSPHEVATPTDAELADAARVVAAQSSTAANLVFLRDKGTIFSDGRDAFLMYGVQGRTWVAMGDSGWRRRCGPGADPQLPRARRRFRRVTGLLRDRRRAICRATPSAGLAIVKLGEEARVDLAGVGVAGSRGARFRQAVRRLERDRWTFRVVPAAEIPRVRSQLRAVSDDWLARKAAAEKGFSLGFFADDYVGRFPAAVVERDGRIQAFATVWPGSDRDELSLDLMRFSAEAPKSVMEALLAHLMLWGKAEGYRHVLSGDGAAVGRRGLAGGAAVEPPRSVRLRARRAALRLSGTPGIQGEVRPALGAALPGLRGRPRPAAGARRRLGARRRRLPPDLHAVSRHARGQSRRGSPPCRALRRSWISSRARRCSSTRPTSRCHSCSRNRSSLVCSAAISTSARRFTS